MIEAVPAPRQDAVDRAPLRALTLNLWGEQGPFAARMALCQREIARLAPDVVALQEVRQIDGQLPNQAETFARALGYHHVFAGAVEWGGGLEGLAILSRAPVQGSGHIELPHATETERRILLHAVVPTPAAQVAVFCTHLNYRMTHGVIREDQVEAVDRRVAEVLAGLSAPALAVLMGDFNATPDHDEIRFLRGLHTLRGRRTYYQDAYLRRHGSEAGTTWSTRNPYTAKLRFLEGDRRIDYIFVSPMSRDGRGQVLECQVVLDQPDEQGVFPSDHFGLLADIATAPDGLGPG